MHLRLYYLIYLSTSVPLILSLQHLFIMLAGRKMLFRSYCSLFFSLPFTFPSSSLFNDSFHHLLCVAWHFFFSVQNSLSLSCSSSRNPLRPPRLGPDAKACRRAHRSTGKPGATLAPNHRSPRRWHS